MRILRPVVLAHRSGMVPLAQVEIMRGGTIRPQPIGHDTHGMVSDILQQLAHQPERRRLVSALLEQHVENLAFIIYRAPEIHPCPANADHHLVEMPARRWVHPRATKRLCNANAKFERPAADRLMADVDTAFSQQILDIAKAHRKAEIEPHRMSNHNSRKSVTGVRDWFHWVRATPPAYRRRGEMSKAMDNLTTPALQMACQIVDGEAEIDLPSEATGVVAMLSEQALNLHARLRTLDLRLAALQRSDDMARRLTTIPGIGPVGATALAASVGDPHQFQSGRQFAAWLGLTPLQKSSGGKERLGRITKMGDKYLRKLLVIGATSLIRRAKHKPETVDPRLVALLEKKPALVASVAMANKMARIAWAIMTRSQVYQAQHAPMLAA
jgi:Transposase IS116/IS110/IS902 family